MSDFAIERHEELFGNRDDRENRCALVEATPDGRAVGLLARHIHRKRPEIDRSYCTLCILTGREPEDLPEVRQRVLERHRRGPWTEGELSDHVRMELVCGECGDFNSYMVRDIVFSTGGDPDSRPSFFMCEEFLCASCGKWPDFKFVQSAMFVLMGSMLRYKVGMSHDILLSPLDVIYRRRKRSVARVIRELRDALKRHPRSVVNLLRMARAQYILGRPLRAMQFYTAAPEVEPVSMEAGLGMARIQADRGDPRKALDTLSNLQESEPNWRFFRLNELSPGILVKEFASLRGSCGRGWANRRSRKTVRAGEGPAGTIHVRAAAERNTRNAACAPNRERLLLPVCEELLVGRR